MLLWPYFVVLAFLAATNAKALGVCVVAAVGVYAVGFDVGQVNLIVFMAFVASVLAQFRS